MEREKAKKIVAALIEDFTDRRRFRQEWDNCDDDVREEIEEQWITIVMLEGE